MPPKAKVKEEKKQAVAELADSIKSARSTVFVDYSGMSVALLSDLRAKLKSEGNRITVAKNTLLKLAGVGAKAPPEALGKEILTGQTAVVFADEDAVSPIQILGRFTAENELARMKGAIVEGTFQDGASLVKIAKLPGREGLYAQVVGGVGAPIYGLLGTLQGNLQKLIWTLQNAKSN